MILPQCIALQNKYPSGKLKSYQACSLNEQWQFQGRQENCSLPLEKHFNSLEKTTSHLSEKSRPPFLTIVFHFINLLTCLITFVKKNTLVSFKHEIFSQTRLYCIRCSLEGVLHYHFQNNENMFKKYWVCFKCKCFQNYHYKLYNYNNLVFLLSLFCN